MTILYPGKSMQQLHSKNNGILFIALIQHSKFTVKNNSISMNVIFSHTNINTVPECLGQPSKCSMQTGDV
jgi:hypothetical protein